MSKEVMILAARCTECPHVSEYMQRRGGGTRYPYPLRFSVEELRTAGRTGCRDCGGQIQFELEPVPEERPVKVEAS